MSRAIPPLLLLSLVVSLATQGCSCSDNGPTRDGGGDDQDGSTSDNGVIQDNGSRDMNRPDVPPFVPPDVHVLITADNAYGFGYGTASALTDYFQGIEDGGDNIFLCSAACDNDTPCANDVECDAFGTCNGDRRGPETYIVPGESTTREGYLYVVVWSDESVTQGLIGQFRAADGMSPTVYTGSPDWEVCATGMDLDPFEGEAPSETLINSQIVLCNAGTTYSGGWIGDELENNPNDEDMELVVLEDVSMEPPQFVNLCQAEDNSAPNRTGDSLDEEARWMWFDEDNSPASTSAFQSNGDPRGDFLIFRLPIESVIIFE